MWCVHTAPSCNSEMLFMSFQFNPGNCLLLCLEYNAKHIHRVHCVTLALEAPAATVWVNHNTWEYSAHRINFSTTSCASRDVLDDTSGRSSEDAGEGLQCCCFSKDDTALWRALLWMRDAFPVSVLNSPQTLSPFPLVIAVRPEVKTEHFPPPLCSGEKTKSRWIARLYSSLAILTV